MLVVPELGGDEDVLTLQAGNIGQPSLDALTDFFLVAIDLGQVKVAVSGLESLVDAVAHLSRSSLPSAVSNARDGMARVKRDSLAERHCAEVFLVDWGDVRCSNEERKMLDAINATEGWKSKHFKWRGGRVQQQTAPVDTTIDSMQNTQFLEGLRC